MLAHKATKTSLVRLRLFHQESNVSVAYICSVGPPSSSQAPSGPLLPKTTNPGVQDRPRTKRNTRAETTAGNTRKQTPYYTRDCSGVIQSSLCVSLLQPHVGASIPSFSLAGQAQIGTSRATYFMYCMAGVSHHPRTRLCFILRRHRQLWHVNFRNMGSVRA